MPQCRKEVKVKPQPAKTVVKAFCVSALKKSIWKQIRCTWHAHIAQWFLEQNQILGNRGGCCGIFLQMTLWPWRQKVQMHQQFCRRLMDGRWWERFQTLCKLEAAVYKYPRRNDRHVPQCPHSMYPHYPHSLFGLCITVTWLEFARYLIFRLLLKSGETGTQWWNLLDSDSPSFRSNWPVSNPRYHPHHWKLRGVCLVAQVHEYDSLCTVCPCMSFDCLFCSCVLCWVQIVQSGWTWSFLVALLQSHRWIERLWDVEFNPAMHDPNGLQCTVAMMWVIFVSNWVMTCDDYFRTSCASVSLICLQIFVSRVELPASAVTWTVLKFKQKGISNTVPTVYIVPFACYL